MKSGKMWIQASRRTVLGGLLCAGILLSGASSLVFAQTDPLPSWNEGAARTAIIDFVTKVTKEGGEDFVPVEERIATFDNDGTLWSEQPMYFQLAFMFDRIKVLAKDHPEWKDRQPYKAVLEGDLKAFSESGKKGLEELMAATYAGMTVEEFADTVNEWTQTARHPRFDQPYTDLVFQPMLELLAYLRDNGFKTYIVSGGGIEFMRPWVEKVYGIPPEQVVGSIGKTSFHLGDDKPVIIKEAGVEFVDNGPGKPVGINRFIGRRPIFAAGNSDGDLQMLQWTILNEGPRFGLIVHHTDALREWAYDRNAQFGKLDKALDEAIRLGWLVVDMKQDWKTIYPFQK